MAISKFAVVWLVGADGPGLGMTDLSANRSRNSEARTLATDKCQSLLERVLEFSHSCENGNRIEAQVRRLGFQVRLDLLAIPAQKWISLLFFFHGCWNRRKTTGS